MKNQRFCSLFFCMLYVGSLCGQAGNRSDITFYKSRILKAPESVFKTFIDAGMQPSNHVLTTRELAGVEEAFSILPPLHRKILKSHLHSISFMDNMPNTALTSTLETPDTAKQFNITFRAGVLTETVSAWASWKENSAFDNTASPNTLIEIDAGNLPAIQYILLHEATHIVDAVLKLTPSAADADSLLLPTAITNHIWRSHHTPVAAYNTPLLENTRFRKGVVQPISSAAEIYTALQKTPFPSLYAMASWSEDIAELITIYHLTNTLHQPFVVYLKKGAARTTVFEPMKNALVVNRLKQLTFFYE